VKYFAVRATTWMVWGETESFFKKVSRDEMRDLGSPKALGPRHLIALGFTPERYQVVLVLESVDNSRSFTTVAQWRAGKSRWPWGKRLLFRPIRTTKRFTVGGGRSKPA